MGEKQKHLGIFFGREREDTNEGEKRKSETNDSPGFHSLPRGVQFRGSGSRQYLNNLLTIEDIANAYMHYVFCQSSLQFDYLQARV